MALLSHPKFDIAIIRGTTGDADGNISMEHEAVKLEMRSIAMAVKATGGKVIVQVKNVAAKGTMTADMVEIPAFLWMPWCSPPIPWRSTGRPRTSSTIPACPAT
jgi:acyl CoA:acetate/3-ketoacid CoA transferase